MVDEFPPAKKGHLLVRKPPPPGFEVGLPRCPLTPGGAMPEKTPVEKGGAPAC